MNSIPTTLITMKERLRGATTLLALAVASLGAGAREPGTDREVLHACGAHAGIALGLLALCGRLLFVREAAVRVDRARRRLGTERRPVGPLFLPHDTLKQVRELRFDPEAAPVFPFGHDLVAEDAAAIERDKALLELDRVLVTVFVVRDQLVDHVEPFLLVELLARQVDRREDLALGLFVLLEPRRGRDVALQPLDVLGELVGTAAGAVDDRAVCPFHPQAGLGPRVAVREDHESALRDLLDRLEAGGEAVAERRQEVEDVGHDRS